MAFLWLALAFVALLYLLQKLVQKKKKLPPGPRGLPIIGNLHMVGQNLHQDLHQFAKKHGPIMSMHFGLVPIIVASSPYAAEQFLKTHDLAFASRPYNEAAHTILYGQRDVAFSKYGPYWRNMRKLIKLQLFNTVKINSFQPTRKQELGILVNSLKRAASNHDEIDVSAKIGSLSANTTCLMIFGKKYMDDDLGEKGFKELGFNRRLKEIAKLFDDFLERVIEEHVKSNEKNETEDIVDTLMGLMQSEEVEFKFDRSHVKAVLLDLLTGSVDTSSTTIDWILSELLRNPEVMKKLQKELEQVVGRNRMVEESDLENLEYLDMVIKEGFRLHPVGPLLIPRESIEDCTVDGFHIPKGSRIYVNVWAIGRDPEAWAEPEKFIPERFIGSNIDLWGRNFELLPFGSGRRSCPGSQLGLTTVRLIVAQLVHCFDWELPKGMMPEDIDMTEKFGLVTGRVQHLLAVPTYRLHM